MIRPIHLLLARAGLSQADAGRLCGVKPQTVNRWMTGRLKPLPGHIEALEALCAEQDAQARALIAGLPGGADPVVLDGQSTPLPVLRRAADILAPRPVRLEGDIPAGPPAWHEAARARRREGHALEAIAAELGASKSAAARVCEGIKADARGAANRARTQAEPAWAAEARRLKGEGLGLIAIAERLGVSKSAVHRALSAPG